MIAGKGDGFCSGDSLVIETLKSSSRFTFSPIPVYGAP
jgi:hypothetical protein